jgi:hypothetical protein
VIDSNGVKHIGPIFGREGCPMPTLMTLSTFTALTEVRKQLVSEISVANRVDQAGPGDILFPGLAIS